MSYLYQQSGKNLSLAADSCLTVPTICGTTCLRGPVLCGTTCVSTAQVIGTKVSVGSFNANYDLYNNGTSYLNGHVTIDDSLTITGAKILKTGGYNKPGIQMTGPGNYSFCDLNVFLKNTGAANSAIFSDYEPHGEWGLFHDNNADAFYITAGAACHNVGSFNMKNCAGTVRTAYIKHKFVQGNGNAEIGGSLSVSPDCSNNYNGMAIGCTYSNIGGWHTQLSMYGTSHVVARWNHSGGSNSGNNAQTNCIFAHVDNPFVMLSSGNIRLCGQDTVCITGKGVACTCFQTPILCAPTCVCSPKVCASSCVHTGDLCLTEDYSGDMSNGIQLGRANGIPQAAWGESGEKTGRIEIGLPTKDGEGGSNHLGMVHMVVDVYEYDGNDVMTFIIGGHNWNCRWYNCGAHITGGCTNKSIKLAYHACGGTCNGRYVALIGECDSTWNYGSVHVRRVNNGLYYLNHMDVGTPMYIKRVTCSDSYYSNTTGDLRSDSKSMAAYQYATTCLHTPRVCATTCVRSSYLYSTGNICGTEFCSCSWFRNANSGQGLYNSGNGFHFYATAANNVRIYGASANNIGLQGYTCGAARGCLHFNCSNQIHIYDSGGNVRFLVNSSNDIRLCNTTCVYGNLVVSGRGYFCGSSESLNFKGARGCFTNEYMHLYNKVGIGHPSGWGCGNTNTPDKGISTYGKGCIGYGVAASTDTLKVAGGVSVLGTKALYSETYANQFYPDAANSWNLQGASGQTTSSLRFRRGDGTIDGYVYSSTGGYIGFLDSASYWAYGHQTNACHWWNISNNMQMKLCNNCLCHCHTICANHCLRANNVEGVTCVHSPVVCGTSCVESCRFQHHWRSIAPGGDYDKFYPISFTMKGGNHSEDILEISQNNVHTPGSSCGAMYLKLGVNITGWGHISNHYIVYKYATSGTNTLVSKVRSIDHSTCRVGVWLRGGVTYYYRSREGTIACNITGGTTACCLSYDNSNNAYDVYVQYTSSVEDNNFGNAGGCNAGSAYLTHHGSLGNNVVLTSGNLQAALCCGCYTNTVCLGNCGVIKNTNFTTGTVCGNDLVRGGHVCGANCVTTGILCSHSCVKIDQGTIRLDGGSCNGGDDATLFVTAYNNNDWGIRVCKNVDSASEYGIKVDLGASATYAYDAVFGGTRKFTVSHNRVCHSGCMLSPVVCGSTCVHGAKICGTHYGDGSNLTGVGGGLCGSTGSANGSCTTLGYCALPSGTGTGNVAIGFKAMQATTSGGSNTASGYRVMCCNTTGHNNTAFGMQALFKNTTGFRNTAIGTGALYNNTASANTAVGGCAMQQTTTGSQNTALGVGALYATTSASSNTSSGYQSAYATTTGNNNTTMGSHSLRINTTGYDNVALGYYAMYGNTTGNSNVAVGKQALQCNTTGYRNVAIGDFAMGFAGCDPHSNVVIGNGAGITPTCCRGCNGYCYNTFIGRDAGDNFMNGTIGGASCWGGCNVAIGAHSGPGSRTNGINNVMIGTNSGYNMQCGASCNLFLGHGSGGAVTTGCKCVVIGYGYGGCYQNASICAACTHVGTLNKSSGSFIIPHPDPAKTATTDLRHSYVESPTRGDNIYRWQVDVTNCCNVITLPSYYQFLNENDMVWVSPVEHFGSAYGKVTEDQCCAIICTNADGKYNVLLVGTRCDCMALNHWHGVEPPMESTSPALSAVTEENPKGPDYPRVFVCNVRKPMSEW